MSAARRWVRNDVIFTGAVVALVGLTYTPLVDPLNQVLCAVSYRGADRLLGALGVAHAADAAHRVLGSGTFALEVSGLCSGLRGLALFGAVLLLLSLPWRRKALHFAVGAAALVAVNVARIVHLFQLGAGGSPRFALYHEWIWPAVIVAAVLLYRLVMLLAARSRPAEVIHG